MIIAISFFGFLNCSFSSIWGFAFPVSSLLLALSFRQVRSAVYASLVIAIVGLAPVRNAPWQSLAPFHDSFEMSLFSRMFFVFPFLYRAFALSYTPSSLLLGFLPFSPCLGD